MVTYYMRVASDYKLATSTTRCWRRTRSAARRGRMVVTNGIERAIQYYHAICDYLVERKSRYQKLVGSSGEEARRVRARLSQRRRHLLRCAPKGAVREYRLR